MLCGRSPLAALTYRCNTSWLITCGRWDARSIQPRRSHSALCQIVDSQYAVCTHDAPSSCAIRICGIIGTPCAVLNGSDAKERCASCVHCAAVGTRLGGASTIVTVCQRVAGALTAVARRRVCGVCCAAPCVEKYPLHTDLNRDYLDIARVPYKAVN